MADKKQQQILEAFFKELFTWNSGNIGMWIVTGIVEVVLGIFMWIPYQELAQDEVVEFAAIIPFWGVWGIMCYILPYIQINENGKVCKVYEKLKYLPVSLQAIRIFRLRKLAVFCVKLFLVFLIGQLFFSLVAFHEITWGNILYPLFFGFLLPFGVNGIVWWWAK